MITLGGNTELELVDSVDIFVKMGVKWAASRGYYNNAYKDMNVSYVIIHLYSTHSMCFISLYALLHLL